MTHLIYHAGDRHVPGHPSLDLEVNDAQVVAFLLGGKHSNGSPIWTLEDEPGADTPLLSTDISAIGAITPPSLKRKRARTEPEPAISLY